MTRSTAAPDSTQLAGLHCTPGAPRLTAAEVAEHVRTLGEWSAVDNAGALEKTFAFADFHATIGFVNALAWMANREDHHPDLRVSYNRCVVTWSTHDAGGITKNDVICAARTDQLVAG
jgi:4a-hydroxytetrahydrobiopterin dehydratase